MLQLIFSVCSIVEGAGCRELPPVPLRENTTLMECAIASQIEGARWVAAHPNYYITRARCSPAGKFVKI